MSDFAEKATAFARTQLSNNGAAKFGKRRIRSFLSVRGRTGQAGTQTETEDQAQTRYLANWTRSPLTNRERQFEGNEWLPGETRQNPSPETHFENSILSGSIKKEWNAD